MNNEIQKADPVERRKLVFMLSCVAGAAALLAVVINEVFFARETVDPELAVFIINILTVSLFIAALPMLLISRKIWKGGAETIRSRRYPPPSMKVIHDTEVITGREAQQRGRRLQLIALVSGAVSIAAPIVVWVVIWIVTRGIQ